LTMCEGRAETGKRSTRHPAEAFRFRAFFLFAAKRLAPSAEWPVHRAPVRVARVSGGSNPCGAAGGRDDRRDSECRTGGESKGPRADRSTGRWEIRRRVLRATSRLRVAGVGGRPVSTVAREPAVRPALSGRAGVLSPSNDARCVGRRRRDALLPQADNLAPAGPKRGIDAAPVLPDSRKVASSPPRGTIGHYLGRNQ